MVSFANGFRWPQSFILVQAIRRNAHGECFFSQTIECGLVLDNAKISCQSGQCGLKVDVWGAEIGEVRRFEGFDDRRWALCALSQLMGVIALRTHTSWPHPTNVNEQTSVHFDVWGRILSSWLLRTTHNSQTRRIQCHLLTGMRFFNFSTSFLNWFVLFSIQLSHIVKRVKASRTRFFWTFSHPLPSHTSKFTFDLYDRDGIQ